MPNSCPKCQQKNIVKSGIINERQRFLCKDCNYYFTVKKLGKQIDDYFVTKALQLYLEGLSFREIERIIGVSHVTISSWIKKYNIKRPPHSEFHTTYTVSYTHLDVYKRQFPYYTRQSHYHFCRASLRIQFP